MNTPAPTIARAMTVIAVIRIMWLEEEGLVVSIRVVLGFVGVSVTEVRLLVSVILGKVCESTHNLQ